MSNPTANTESTRPKLPSDKIIGPAIMRFGLVYSLPKPYRHHDIIRKMDAAGVKNPGSHEMGTYQGFLTVDGFMTRAETLDYIGADRSQIIGGVLTSEDLW